MVKGMVSPRRATSLRCRASHGLGWRQRAVSSKGGNLPSFEASRGLRVRVRIATSDSVSGSAVLQDILAAVHGGGKVNYYDVLGVDEEADFEDIRSSYRIRAKVCHPDLAGEEGHDACILLNEAYAILGDDHMRAAYDVERKELMFEESNPFSEAMKRREYTGDILSRWTDPGHAQCKTNTEEQRQRGVFVDEVVCIGCKNCMFCAPAVFIMEPDHGRSRVKAQWRNKEEDIQEAIDTCPVDCIHWVSKEQLAPLEYVMQHVMRDRVNVGVMLAGQGRHRVEDVFSKTRLFTRYLSERKQRMKDLAEEQRVRRENARKRAEVERENKEKYQGKFWGWVVTGRFDSSADRAPESKRAKWATVSVNGHGNASGAEEEDGSEQGSIVLKDQSKKEAGSEE